MVAEEEASEVNVLDFVQHRVQGGNLADVVGHQVEEGTGHVRLVNRLQTDRFLF